ncbi:MAG: PQQ-binding-like beta-propeller repeat protein [Actinomycetota bacterium]
MSPRREYVSFFSDGRGHRRDFAGFEGRPGLIRFALPTLAIALLGVSVWWFAFREADRNTGEVLTLEDSTIPTLLMPAGSDSQDVAGIETGETFDCIQLAEGWTMFQGSISRQGCYSANTIVTPAIMWRTEIGVQGWLNNPVIANGSVYVGSAGVAQFTADRRDGIYSLDLLTGTQNWFYATELDVNGVVYDDGVVIATGDEGRVWGIGARDGERIWSADRVAPVYGNPLVVGGLVIVGDGAGHVTAYDPKTGVEVWDEQVDGAVRGGAASDGSMIVVAGENHEILALDLNGEQLWRVVVPSQSPDGAASRIFAAPTIVDDMVIVGYVRSDVYAEPAIAALDKATGAVRWRAADVAGIKTQWANVRSSPAVVGAYLVFAEAYSNSLVAIDLETGQTRFAVETGLYCQAHWPSPAVVGNQVIVPRNDGGLYAVDLAGEALAWKIYLGNSANPSGNFPPGFDASSCDEGFPILASPAVSPEGIVVVGTLQGDVVAVGDRNWR